MALDEALSKQVMASFREELAERLASINTGLLVLEEGVGPERREETLEELFRHVHSLKGAARAVNLKPIEELAHGLEDVFSAARQESISLAPTLFDLLYRGLDLMGAVMGSMDAGYGVDPALDLPGYLAQLTAVRLEQRIPPAPVEEREAPLADDVRGRPTPFGEAPVQSWAAGTIRVPTTRLDELMAQAGELLVARQRSDQRLEEVKELHGTVARWQQYWHQVRERALGSLQRPADGDGGHTLAFLMRNEDSLRSLMTWLDEHIRHLSDDTTRLALVTDELQDGVRKIRMLPLATLLGTFRRMVRDLAREKGVEVNLEVQGADTEMDKQVLEQIKDPLMHLLRNCIDHGIELAEEREKQGKPRQGIITLSADRRGNVVVVEISDDGAGIDIAGVRDAAVRRGLLRPEVAREMSTDEVISLVFLAGLSTSPIITEVSGRGIGLDIVRRNVEALQGRVEVHTVPGRGTTFTLTLPLTLVSTHCLLLRVVDQIYALPVSAVWRLIPVSRGEIISVEGRQAIRYQGHPLSLVYMADVLEQPDRGRPFDGEEPAPAVVLMAGGQQIAFLVDELLDEQEVVVKSLGGQLRRVRNVAGATILGTGQVILILNVTDLVRSTQRAAERPLPAPEGEPTVEEERKVVLVVDDSITTRTLEKNILTAAGYEVRLAIDGEEALTALAEQECDLIVADIDMPRLDGFELTQRLKQSERYRELPVILVTSLESSEDKARGIAVGADAYIVKSTFDQDVLLDTIGQLI